MRGSNLPRGAYLDDGGLSGIDLDDMGLEEVNSGPGLCARYVDGMLNR